MAFTKGMRVTTSAMTDINGTHLAPFVRKNTYDILEVHGDRIVIGQHGKVTAAVKANTLEVDPSSITQMGSPSVQTKADTPSVPIPDNTASDKTSNGGGVGGFLTSLSSGIDKTLTNMIDNYGEDITKYTMKLFGLPHQFTQYCDYRTYSISNKPKSQLIGRTFIENIMLEAPVVTIVPGQPIYLPAVEGDKKKQTAYMMVQAANGNVAALLTNLDETKRKNALRYYDFQQTYVQYMNYVNILCQVSAAFLDLNGITIDGSTTLDKFDWKDYRWTKSAYTTASKNIADALKNKVGSTIKGLASMMGIALSSESSIPDIGKSDEKDAIGSISDILTQMNFVEFYVDAGTSGSDGFSNQHEPSKLSSIYDSADDFGKEIAFLVQSGGVDDTQLKQLTTGAADAMSSVLSQSKFGIAGVMSRLLSTTSNVISGETMVFPEIYKKSSYGKSYNLTVDLRTPYGNKLGFYLDILVPLWHLIALAVPKQTTANTYGSPFLVKAYYPGVFACNLGIISNMTISKCPDGGEWSVDGYPTHIRVDFTIDDLYSDMSITPSGDITLFLANSSLIDFIASQCGISLVTPQLSNRIALATTIVKSAVVGAGDNVSNAILGGLENLIASITGV